ncbi:hypothetical protein MTR_7g053650 [Medicago truncatula]|uniref:Uncharacterized protein n=1 Tax=Medicago truncatula TaxID=3880 RepID=A0A072TYQ5_MEDTR|nr:hypothetical protein MTR_7g053650 [Medicago truncatula]
MAAAISTHTNAAKMISIYQLNMKPKINYLPIPCGINMNFISHFNITHIPGTVSQHHIEVSGKTPSLKNQRCQIRPFLDKHLICSL